MCLIQESVEGDDVTVGVSSPTTYIRSPENSLPTIVSSGDDVVVSSNTAELAFDRIQPCVPAAAQQAGPTVLAVDLTTSPELPTLENAASKYTYFLIYLPSKFLGIPVLFEISSYKFVYE